MKRSYLALLVCVLVLSACGTPDDEVREAVDYRGAKAPQTKAEGAELSFLMGMVPHHAQAVDMAHLCKERALDERLRRLCHRVVEVQTEEMRLMKRWALKWYGTLPSEVLSALHSVEGAHGSAGILSDEMMKDLARKKGREFDIAFATHMIHHHDGAVESAEYTARIAPHPEFRELASAIATAQRAEVRMMRRWTRGWSRSRSE